MARKGEEWMFEGFSSPNSTQVPDEFFDVVAPRLSGSEVKVILYIIRRTYGFKKENDNISLSQMQRGIVRRDGHRLDYGAGVSKPTLLDALKSLEAKGIIQRTLQWDKSGDPSATNYQLRMRTGGVGKKTYLPPKRAGKKTYLPQGEDLTNGLVKKPTSQYTVNNIQLYKNVNGSPKTKRRNLLHELPDAQADPDHIQLIADDILDVLGDKQSERFYLLVARKVPEGKIRGLLSELKDGNARSKARVFTSKVMELADEGTSDELAHEREALAKRYKKH
jgi:hypothetical protein